MHVSSLSEPMNAIILAQGELKQNSIHCFLSRSWEGNILHAAAFLEFKQHVERLARESHDLAAYTCWVHAVEIRHSPFVIPTTSESELFPPWSKCPAARETVSVAQLTCGGLVSWRVAKATRACCLDYPLR